jgi:hypothetical protein
MSAKKQIVISLVANATQFRKQMDRVSRDMTRMGKEMQASGRAMTMSLTAPIVAMAALSVKAFDKQAKAIAQVEQGLRSTGNAAGWTSEELQKLAADMQSKTIFGDEEILQKATAQLLTFTTIASEEFSRAQQAALDLATRLDGDLQSATIMVGKALNDPIRGLAAMGKAGVQFTDQQKKVIKELWNTGQQAEAQRMILAELEKQYGGSAEAAAKAGIGGIQQLKNSIGDLSEEFGKIITENIQPFIERVKATVTRMQSMDEATKKNITRFAGLLAVLGPVKWIIGAVVLQAAKMVKMIGMLNLVLKAGAAGWGKFTMAMKANVITAGITALVIGITLLSQAMKRKNEMQKMMNETSKDANIAIRQEQSAMDSLFESLKKTAPGSKERENLMRQVNEKYPELLKNYKSEKEFLDNITKAQKQSNEEIKNRIMLETADAQRAKLIEKQISLETKRAQLLDRINRAREMQQGATPETFMAQQSVINQAQRALGRLNNELETNQRIQANVAVAGDKLRQSLSGVSMAAGGGDSAGGGDKVSASTAVAKLQAEISALEGKLKDAILLGKPTEKLMEQLTPKKDQLEKMEQGYNILVGYGSALTKLNALESPKIEIEIDAEEWEKVEMTIDNLPSRFHRAQEAAAELTESFKQLAVDGIGLVATAIGGLVAGEGKTALQEFSKSFLTMIADFATSFGTYLIALGVGIEAFKVSLASLNPVVAVAAGIAMVAAGAAIKSLINKQVEGFALGTNFAPGGMAIVGERGPELVNLPRGSQVIPNHRMHNIESAGGGQLITILRGADLQIALDRNSKRQGRYR